MLMQAQDTSKLTAKYVYEDMKAGFQNATEGIVELASKLEGPAKRTYGIYVQQQKIKGITHGVVAIFLVLLGILFVMPNYGRADWNGAGNKYVFPAVVGIILCAAAFIVMLTFFAGSGLAKVINPEYYAIQDILDFIKAPKTE